MKPRPRPVSLKAHIGSAILLTALCILLPAYTVLLFYEWRNSGSEIVASLDTETEVLARNSVEAMVHRSAWRAHNVLSSVSGDPRIRAAYLYDNDRRLLAAWARDGVPSDPPFEPWDLGGHRILRGDAWIVRDVTRENLTMGTLMLQGSMAGRVSRLLTFAVISGAVFGTGLVIAALFSRLFKRRITAPVLGLARSVDKIARSRDFSLRIDPGPVEEVRTVAEAFNQLLVEVQDRDTALLGREREFRALVEQSPDIICRFDRDTRIVYISPASARVVGRPPSHYIGRTLAELQLNTEQRRLWEEAIRRVYETARPTLVEYDLETSEHGSLTLHTRLVPEIDDSGAVTGVLSIARDITERRRVEEALRTARDQAEAAARSKSTFLANMSHDIRTPLTTIIGFAEILSDRLDEEDRELSDIIREGGRRLLDTLNSVLDLARYEGGPAVLNPRETDLKDELLGLHKLFKPRADEKGLGLELKLPPGPVTAVLDRAALGRIVMNLVGNAVKFTEKGQVLVELRQTASEILVSVTDTGPGIPADSLPHIFNAFSRARASEAERLEGSGLGLTISRQLAGLLGGAIAVHSEPGQGSVFTLSIPRPRAKPKPNTGFGYPQGSLKSILVAEDNPNIQALLRVILAGRYSTTICERSDDTVQQALNDRFDLVLMDIALESSEAGIECLRRIRRIEGYEETPVIAFTAHAMPDERDRFQRLGFNDLLQKPFSPHQLNDMLERYA